RPAGRPGRPHGDLPPAPPGRLRTQFHQPSGRNSTDESNPTSASSPCVLSRSGDPGMARLSYRGTKISLDTTSGPSAPTTSRTAEKYRRMPPPPSPRGELAPHAALAFAAGRDDDVDDGVDGVGHHEVGRLQVEPLGRPDGV